MKAPPICGIYMIVNGITSERYIGQSVDILRRWAEHKTPKANGSPKLHEDMKRIGTHRFYILILEECDAKDLDTLEMKYIKMYKPEYNRCLGGKGSVGHIVSTTAKEQCRQGALKQWREMDDITKTRILSNLKRPEKGHKVSDATKKKISESLKGTKRNQSAINKQKETMILKKKNGYIQTNAGHKKSVICVNNSMIFDSVKEASEFFKIDASSVSSVLKGRRKSTHGLVFIYGGKENGNN